MAYVGHQLVAGENLVWGVGLFDLLDLHLLLLHSFVPDLVASDIRETTAKSLWVFGLGHVGSLGAAVAVFRGAFTKLLDNYRALRFASSSIFRNETR